MIKPHNYAPTLRHCPWFWWKMTNKSFQLILGSLKTHPLQFFFFFFNLFWDHGREEVPYLKLGHGLSVSLFPSTPNHQAKTKTTKNTDAKISILKYKNHIYYIFFFSNFVLNFFFTHTQCYVIVTRESLFLLIPPTHFFYSPFPFPLSTQPQKNLYLISSLNQDEEKREYISIWVRIIH